MSKLSRRAVLGAGTASLAALAGCSALDGREDLPSLSRIVLRADTGETEQMRLTLVYAPRDGSNRRPIWGTIEVPPEDVTILEDFENDPGPGFYSLTAVSTSEDNHEVVSFNSHGNAVGDADLQFEVVVQKSGDVWANVADAGDDIDIPGYSP
jgi:hypothetical protein